MSVPCVLVHAVPVPGRPLPLRTAGAGATGYKGDVGSSFAPEMPTVFVK